MGTRPCPWLLVLPPVSSLGGGEPLLAAPVCRRLGPLQASPTRLRPLSLSWGPDPLTRAVFPVTGATVLGSRCFPGRLGCCPSSKPSWKPSSTEPPGCPRALPPDSPRLHPELGASHPFCLSSVPSLDSRVLLLVYSLNKSLFLACKVPGIVAGAGEALARMAGGGGGC